MTTGCAECCKAEFQPRNFLMGYNCPGKFVQFECGCPKGYILWRIFGALFTIALVTASVLLSPNFATSEANERKWPIFLTNWSLLVLMLSAVTDLVTTVYVQASRKDLLIGKDNEMPWYLQVNWVFYNVAEAAALVISVLYWTLLYKDGQSFEGYRILPFLSHGLNSIYAIANLCVTGIPTRILHAYQPLIFGIVYVIFTGIYHAAGGTNHKDEPYIYDKLDWSKPDEAAPVAVAAGVTGIVAHILIYFISLLRQYLSSHCCGCSKDVVV